MGRSKWAGWKKTSKTLPARQLDKTNMRNKAAMVKDGLVIKWSALDLLQNPGKIYYIPQKKSIHMDSPIGKINILLRH